MLKILVPENRGIARIAAAEFASLWGKVTGEKLPVTVRDDFYATPLRELARDCDAAAKRLSANLKNLADRIDVASMPRNGP